MPQAGFEPAPMRFLRPPPLPLGYCGQRFSKSPARTSRADLHIRHLQCSEQDSNLHQRDSHSRASSGWATGAFSMDRGGNRTLIVRVQAGCLPVRRRALCFSVLREGFEPSSSGFGGQCSSNRAAATSSSFLVGCASAHLNDPGRIRTCTKLVLSQPPLPIGLLDLFFKRSPKRTLRPLHCTEQDSNPHKSG